jgi:hypothetical protein
MISLRRIVRSRDGSAAANLDQRDGRRAETIHVLSVGPLDRSFIVHDAMLMMPDSRLSIATDYRELWEIPKQQAIHVVILHETLTLFELDEACRFIRQQWPCARVLAVRVGEVFLDDELYDDRVAPTVEADVLLTTIERLAIGRHERSFKNAKR